MLLFDTKIQSLIEKACKGKKHIKLTIGTYANNEKTIRVFDETGEIENENDIYEIGSITKTFTCSLLAKYIYEGKMSLEDSVSKYVIGLDSNAYYPTLKRLATHTAGYSRNLPLSTGEMFKLVLEMILGSKKRSMFPFQMDLEKMKRLLQENMLQDKDYSWQYSNFGMALLGNAIGIASGQGYWDTMNDFLSSELGLKHSYTGTCPDKNLHGYNKKNIDIGNWVWGKDLTAPAGDISSTAEDMLAYARVNVCEELPYLALCHQKHMESKKLDIGLGWIMTKDKNPILWHNGGTGAFRSYLGIDKQKKCASVVLSNYFLLSTDKIGLSVLKQLQNR
jgi:CubicO group peptidase (beta-lactamase class C family)